jgi:hypothetical protein
MIWLIILLALVAFLAYLIFSPAAPNSRTYKNLDEILDELIANQSKKNRYARRHSRASFFEPEERPVLNPKFAPRKIKPKIQPQTKQKPHRARSHLTRKD